MHPSRSACPSCSVSTGSPRYRRLRGRGGGGQSPFARLAAMPKTWQAGEMDLPHILVVKDQCQYFVPSLFRSPWMRPLLERWFWQAGSRWKVFSPLGRWLFGDLASHLEHRVTSFVQVHKLYPGASNRFRACAQNRFVEAADWWAQCIRELSAGASTQVFIATMESQAQLCAQLVRNMQCPASLAIHAVVHFLGGTHF